MKIGELAARLGMAASAIRFYEQSGLLPAATRGANGYRVYDATAEERLRQIQLAQRLGFTLDEIRTAIKEMGDFSKDGLLGRIDQRLHEIDTLRARLDEQRAALLGVRDALQAEWAAGRCFKVDQFEVRQCVAREEDAHTGEAPGRKQPPVRTRA
ncbi:MerR family transcriptional regulator [Paraburkholderia susongensis]|uniref:DNA-binding transcriptional regulator, MerR family n=1 Tax=Paraburkholderia susongensis TaxID=1515439 RepID=A0A1X7I9P7_9BURK|nr:MerR family transcriptional regulator [Paraburkholderia susongensis]SMG10832.1 DNA-binding transcriptional regulator, MerR family [Paraburkholderia susongensis]